MPSQNATKAPAKTITIMPDFGMGPWAWEKSATDETEYVGGNIASAVDGMSGYSISKELEQAFADWVIHFENDCKNKGFDWQAFHRQGMMLAKRLKQELGDTVRVVYVKPYEDPNRKINGQMEVL